MRCSEDWGKYNRRASCRIVPDPSTNGTAIDLHNPTSLHYMHSVGVSGVFLLCSALYAGFMVITVHISDKGVGEIQDVGYSDYTSQNTDISLNPTITMWNNVFVATLVASHSLIAAIVTSPTSIHFLLLVALLNYLSLSFVVQPRIQSDPEHGSAAAGAVSSRYMLAVSAYVLGMMYVGTNIPHDPFSYKVEMVGCILILDTFLLIFGHTWDPVPNMHTVINCRLVYTIAMIAITMLVYIIWQPYLRVPYI